MGLTPFEDIENEVQEVAFGEGNLDAFGRLRTSQPETIFDCVFKRDKQPLIFWESTTLGSLVTHLGDNPSVQLSCSITPGSTSVFQTRNYFQYSQAKSNIIFITGNFIEAKTSVKKRIGYFDNNDGYFFELNGSVLSAVIRSKVSGFVVDNAIPQSSWNIDKLDGSGASGKTYDITKQVIWFIDFQWLGSGRVRFGFYIDSDPIICHEFDHSNILSVPYCRTAKLPIRAEISNSGINTSTMNLTCVSVISEGSINKEGIFRTTNSDTAAISFGSTQLKPVISIRKGSSFISEIAKIISLGLFASSADDFLIYVYKNATLTGASWTALS